MSEQRYIKRFEAIFSQNSLQKSIDLKDDCAFLSEEQLICTTDHLCEGVHFDLKWDRFYEIGRQAAIVNLSDIAASGGKAKYLLWSLVLPKDLSEKAVISLSKGFQSVCNTYDCLVVGGNLCRRPGKLEISVTAIGSCCHPIERNQAKDGDLLYVSGYLGERALGYLYPSKTSRSLRHQWYPHLKEAQQLVDWQKVTSMMDISDGLLIDAQRLANASGICIEIDSNRIPLSHRYQQILLNALKKGKEKDHQEKNLQPQEIYDKKYLLEPALSGGEDYVLLFTAPPSEIPPINAYCIGKCRSGQGIRLDGQAISGRGFDHLL
jgi:thiamine-monophosphate kinase